MYKKIILAAGLWILMFTACTKQKQYFEESGSVFHTIYHIKYEGSEILTEKIDAEFQKFNLSLNPFNPNSIISKVNRNEAVEADDWFIEVFNKAKEVSDHSEGIFDITPQMIDSIKQFVGYQKVRLDGRKVVKDDSRILLNCSAIAKGYASDVIARLLEREGIENYMVEIGGEVTMKGVNQNGKCWRIGINKPEDDSTGIKNDIEEVVQLCKKGGVATSGNYRNYYVKDGKKYAHTIDPRTGYPSEQSILSATIVAEECITADAYASAFMAMGLEKAREAAKNIPGIEYYVIYSDENGKHQIEYSTGMLQYLPNRPIEAMLNE